MSLTTLAFVFVYVVGLSLAFHRPIYGLCTYVWTFYNSPATSWWGSELPDLRWSLTAAVITLVASLVAGTASSTSEADEGAANGPASLSVAHDWGARLLLLLVAWMWVQSVWAVDAVRHLAGCILFTKFLVLYVLIHRIIRDRRSVEIFAWIHVVGAFTWGWTGYRTAVNGRFEPLLGPAMDDANSIAFQIVTATAFAGFMFIGLRGFKRWAAFGTLPFLLNAVILTASRSALLGLMVAGLVALWMTPRAHRRAAYVCAALGVVLFLRLAGSDLFWARAATIAETDVADMDGSASSRIEIAAANWRMFVDHPFGAGYGGNASLSPRYLPEALLGAGGVRSSHNTILAVLVDMGVPGACCFLLILLTAARGLIRLRALNAAGSASDLGIYRAAAGAGFTAFLVSGQFINLLSAEVWVWLLALMAVLGWIGIEAREPVVSNVPGQPRQTYVPRHA